MARQIQTGSRESSGEPQRRRTKASEPRAGSKVAVFPIVGIGASAGGLAALTAFFSGMPGDLDSGMAFIVVQHLAPDHPSLLSDLIQRQTTMQVVEVEDGTVVEPNRVYIIPPGRDMALLNGTLQLLTPTAPHGQRLPIDFFFRSLADDRHEHAICVVLAGAGSDGTLGLRSIKGEGGMAMAQNPESAEFDGMPTSAIATGLVDYVVPPAEMPAQLMEYAAHAFAHRPKRVPRADASHSEGELKRIFVLLRARSGNDFSFYKRNTIMRRVERRMAVNHVDSIEEYVRCLQEDPEEIDALHQDLLIGVTSFFRDPAAFSALEKKVIARILASKEAGDRVRMWVPACSTGEEAYSVAIMLLEQMDALGTRFDTKIFATDIDSRAIGKARAGVYPSNISADVSEVRLSRYFTRESPEGALRVAKVVRDMIVFSEQNAVTDPPFSQLDFVSCRNLLIYLSGPLQRQLVAKLQYALKPGGFLCVGASESLTGFGEWFETVDAKAKIYRRKEGPALSNRMIAEPSSSTLGESTDGRGSAEALGTDSNLRELIESEILGRSGLVAALVDSRGEMLYVHGRAGLYLEQGPGKPGTNILKMAREGLGWVLTAALEKAAAQTEPAVYPGVRVKTNGEYTSADLTVSLVQGGSPPGGPATYLVLLEEARQPAGGQASQPVASDTGDAVDSDARVSRLMRELAAKEGLLQTTVEKMETSNEELQSANEELQSANEELETSDEELQSTNEELATVNAELQERLTDLSRIKDDTINLLAGTGIGSVFVDCRLNIRHFTAPAVNVMNLILSDVGRPIMHVTSNLAGYDRFFDDLSLVLETLEPLETEVQTREGRWYVQRIQPYRTVENMVDGLAITFTEITRLMDSRASLAETQRRLAAVLNDASDAIMVCDLEGRILAWNPAAVRLYGWTQAEALAMNVRELVPESARQRELAAAIQLARSKTVKPRRAQRITKDGREITVTLAATQLVDERANPYAVSTLERTVTDDD
jgi:two-component system, chemotaxis family, CheB/CheR fusion protein